MPVLAGLLVLGSALSASKAVILARRGRTARLLGEPIARTTPAGDALVQPRNAVGGAGGDRSPIVTVSPTAIRMMLLSLAACLGLGVVGYWLAPPAGALLGAGLGAGAPLAHRRRLAVREMELVERQLVEAGEAMRLGIRSGLSVVQAIEAATREAELPLRAHLERVLAERRLGVPLHATLDRLAASVGTEDARLLVLVLSLESRGGANLAAALERVAATVRYRVALRRQLRALSAQGRISATVLGALPIVFFVVLAATSRRDLEPVFRSPAGIGMLAAGAMLQAAAYLWIRRLLRVEA